MFDFKCIWFILLPALLFYSCEYEPKDVYHHPANKNVEAPQLEIVKLTLGDVNDTIYLHTNKFVQFQFQSNPQEILAIEFILDDEPITAVESNNGAFSLFAGQLADGNHTLTMTVYTSTGTGSIADQIGAEAFIFSKSWTVAVDKNRKLFVKTEAVDGYLKIIWEKCRANDFKEYVVQRSIWWSGESKEIRRLQSNELVDNSYVGEGGRYTIWINDIYDELTFWCEVELEREFPVIQAKAIENNVYQLYWKKHKYYNAVSEYQVNVKLDYVQSFDKTTLNPNDTIIESGTAYFADRASITIKLIPDNANPFYASNYLDAFQNVSDIKVGYYFNDNLSRVEILQFGSDGFSFVNGCDTIKRYSFEQKKIVQRLGYPPHYNCYGCTFSRTAVSSSGKSFTANIACWDNVLMVNSENLHNHTVHDLRPYTGLMYSPTIQISDVGLAIVNSIEIDGFYLYDYNTSSALTYHPQNGISASGEKISPNGEYIFLRDNEFKLVKYVDGQFVNIGTFSGYNFPYYYDFDPVNPDRFMIWSQNTFFIISTVDFSVINQFELTDTYLHNIDFARGEILTRNDNHLYIRNLETGQILKDIVVSSNSGKYILVNRILLNEDCIMHYIN